MFVDTHTYRDRVSDLSLSLAGCTAVNLTACRRLAATRLLKSACMLHILPSVILIGGSDSLRNAMQMLCFPCSCVRPCSSQVFTCPCIWYVNIAVHVPMYHKPKLVKISACSHSHKCPYFDSPTSSKQRSAAGSFMLLLCFGQRGRLRSMLG